MPDVLKFIGSDKYQAHKAKRFRSENPDLTENEAFLLSDPATKSSYENVYEGTRSLYYRDRPSFSEILARIGGHAGNL